MLEQSFPLLLMLTGRGGYLRGGVGVLVETDIEIGMIDRGDHFVEIPHRLVRESVRDTFRRR